MEERAGGGLAGEVNPFTEDLVRRQASRLLRGQHRGRFLCFSCLAEAIRDATGTSRTKGQIERALLMVSLSLAALVHKPSFVCDVCGNCLPCLGAHERRQE